MLRIKELREKKGFNQKEFSKVIGIAQNTLSQYETGKRQPDIDTLTKFAEYFNVSTDYLLGREEQKSSDSSELKGVYLNFAKRAQDNGLDPADIELILATAERLRNKKPEEK